MLQDIIKMLGESYDISTYYVLTERYYEIIDYEDNNSSNPEIICELRHVKKDENTCTICIRDEVYKLIPQDYLEGLNIHHDDSRNKTHRTQIKKANLRDIKFIFDYAYNYFIANKKRD